MRKESSGQQFLGVYCIIFEREAEAREQAELCKILKPNSARTANKHQSIVKRFHIALENFPTD